MVDARWTPAKAPAAAQEIAGCSRRADLADLALALQDCRETSLGLYAAFERALPGPRPMVPLAAGLNPPLWELGHIAWFQEYWLARNTERHRGAAADPDASRRASRLAQADAWYDSSRVAHGARWQLPLPDAGRTREYLAGTLEDTLALLAGQGRDAARTISGADGAGPGLGYFAWLALSHEDMHGEAALIMANRLGVPVDAAAPVARGSAGTLEFAPAGFDLGSAASAGAQPEYAFDNELPARRVALRACSIDRVPVSNAAYADFVNAGGYEDAQWWTDSGWAWRSQCAARWPRFWRRAGSRWQQCWFSRWMDVADAAPVSNVNLHEAQAWCRWAGRRLPDEAQWERAALDPPAPGAAPFDWGQVWEWTSSAFLPYPGFTAHPYRDYSRPWFGSHQVLRGASFATHARMRHPRYRNFYLPERNDIFAGFRSCAVDPSDP